jgi:serine/threonine protein kinase
MVFVQNHRLEKVIAQGSSSEVWAAVRLGPGGFASPVALKSLIPRLQGSRRHVRAFVNEARAASYVQHRNVVQAREMILEDGRYWLSMERVRGWTLRTVMTTLARTGRQMPMEVAVALARDAAAGLQAIHDAGLIHRNITPDNLMIAASGHLVVLDFGCAAWRLSERVRFTPPIDPLEPVYASPQMLGGARVDARTDVYSLGAVLHQLVPRKADVPVGLEGIIARTLEHEPEQRFPSARELEIVLELISIRERWPVTPSYVAAYLTEVFAGTEAALPPLPKPPASDDDEARYPELEAPTAETGDDDRATDPAIRAAPPAPRRARTAAGTSAPPRLGPPPAGGRRATTQHRKTHVRVVRR